MECAGQAAIVTGGGSGLGEATALALAAAGCRVAVLDRDAAAAADVAARSGGLACACDVTEEGSVAAALEAARAAHGVARIVVNCAGVATPGRVVGRDGPLPLAAFEQVVRVNLFGTFNVLRLAAAAMAGEPGLEDGERGVVINTASVAAYDGQVGQAAYAASKGAIVSMTLPIARELARFGVRVVTVAPGLFLTPLLATLPAEVQESLGAAIPYPARLGRPSEFAAFVLSLVGNRYVNGETIRLDGALRMAPK